MSFFDPVFDVFADLGDSIGDFAESDEGKLALIVAAAALTNGASLGAEGGAGFLAGMPEVTAIEGSGVAGTGISSGIIPTVTPIAAGITGAGASTIPTIPTGLTTTGIPPIPDIGAANVTAIQQGAGPITGPDATQLAELTQKGITTDAAAQNAVREQIANNAIRQNVAPEAASNLNYAGNSTALPNVQSPAANYSPYAPNPVGGQGLKTAGATAPSMEGIKVAQGATLPPTEPNFFQRGIDAFSNLNPYAQFGLGYLGAYNLGLLDPRNAPEQEKYNGVLTRYKMSPNFQASNVQPNVYRPRYAAAGGIMQAGGPVEAMSNANAIGANTGFPQANIHQGAYAAPWQTPVPQNVVEGAADTGIDQNTGEMKMASGGIAHFRRGNLADSLDFYKSMTEGQGGKGATAPKGDADVGIYYDLDPDTRYQDALTAAQIRQAKVNKRAYVSPPVAKRPAPMGKLNLNPPGAQETAASSSLDPEMAAQGGIMHSSLGGYAAGGNPRLLRGPGDGMSDNIPATIAGKQPARLADGEFVVPADVVSHLGNGSTEAGAKKLHEMMNKVRKARTGNPKQGKQINPNKFMPA